MNAQVRIDAFTLAARRPAVERSRANPGLLLEAIEVLHPWRLLREVREAA